MAQEAKAKEETKTGYQWNVGMTCDGCKNQITKILNKQKGDLKEEEFQFDIDVGAKTVILYGTKVIAEEKGKEGAAIDDKIKKWCNLKEKSYKYVGKVELKK